MTDITGHLQGLLSGPGETQVPAGIWEVSTPLTLAEGAALHIGPGSTLVAAAPMQAMVQTPPDRFVRSVRVSGGGQLDCANLADIGVWGRGFANMPVTDLRIHAPLVAGIKLGDPAMPRSAEAVVSRIHVTRASADPMPPGSWGILAENSGDHSLSQVVVQSQESGIKLDGAGSVATDCHVWHDPTCGDMLVCFDDSGGNDYIACSADTPTVYGWHLRGSNTKLTGGKVYLNPNYALDNIVVGVKFDSPWPTSSLVGVQFIGGSGARLAKDVDAPDLTAVKMAGCFATNTVSILSTTDRTVTVRARDIVVAPRTLPTASANFRGQIAYVNGATDEADVAYICRKNAANGYEWVALT